ncbi:MAG: outer membrane protein [Gemmatimonadaceae bacterium]
MDATPSSAQEQAPRPLSFGLGVGAVLPIGDLGDFAGLGFHVGGMVHYESPSFPLGLRGELGFANLGGKTVNVGSQTFEGPDTRILSAVGNVMYAFRRADIPDEDERSFPFAIGGLGLYNFRFSDSDVPGSSASTTDFGINVGGGLQFGLAGLKAFAEARYHHIFSDEPSNFIPLTFGLIF